MSWMTCRENSAEEIFIVYKINRYSLYKEPSCRIYHHDQHRTRKVCCRGMQLWCLHYGGPRGSKYLICLSRECC